MDVAIMSTKGQIVIPEALRKEYDKGSPFLVSKVDDLIILKPINDLTIGEKKELKELNRIWKKIDEGKTKSYSEKEFFKAMKKW